MILVVPMAGDGSRFLNNGYTTIKPLIKILDKPMFQHVVDPLLYSNKLDKLIFIVRRDHVDNFNLIEQIEKIYPVAEFVIIDKKTEGAACSILLLKEYIDNDEELAVINCDNIIEFDNLDIPNDGKIFTFEDASCSPKWSYAKLNDKGHVAEVKEKQPISSHATAGLYLWKKGSSFVKAAEQMIAKDIRFNGEFYLAPVYNENIVMGEIIDIAPVISVDIVGTPEDLNTYLAKSA